MGTQGSGPDFLIPELTLSSLCESEVAQLYQTLCHPMDCSLPGAFVHGIFQARVLKWVAISFSRRSSLPRDQTNISLYLLHWQAGSLPLVPPGKPLICTWISQTHLILRSNMHMPIFLFYTKKS